MKSLKSLPKNFKTKFLKALRSGEYPQGQDRLTDGVKYCCLGVACEVAGVKKIPKNYQFIPSAIADPKKQFKKVPQILKGDQSVPRELAHLNDDGKSFKEIADYIEANL